MAFLRSAYWTASLPPWDLAAYMAAVGSMQDLAGAAAMGRIGSDPERQGWHDGILPLEETGGVKTLADLLGALGGDLDGRVRQDDGELFAANRHGISPARTFCRTISPREVSTRSPCLWP